MTADRPLPLTRRALLRAAAGAGTAAFLASCGEPATPAATPTASRQLPAATALPPTATATAAPTPTPTPNLDLMIGQMTMVGFAGTTAAPESPVHTDVHTRFMGGTVLFARNATSRSQVGALTGALQLAATTSSLPLLISTDQEGGQVQRLGPGNGFAALPSAAAMGNRGSEYARAAGEQCGEMLAAAGVNLNLAPVVDVNVNRSNPVIGAASRSFSPEPDTVAASAGAFIEGHHAHGVLTALKHFPGHGSSRADSHLGFVDVTTTWSEAELVPYQALIGQGLADVVMAAHVFNANLDPEFPASLSKATITGLLREQLGFEGVVMTDSLQMGAITLHWTFEDAIRLAIEAGADILAYTNALLEPDLCERVHGAVRSLVDSGVVPVARLVESFERIQRLKARLPSPADGG